MRKLVAIFTLVVLATLPVGVVAAAVAPPPIDLVEAYGFSNVLETDDRLILVRYDLPLDDWQIDSSMVSPPTLPVAFMVDATCETPTEPITLVDPCYTSIYNGMVLHTFYDGARGGPGVTQIGIRSIPRIWQGLSGIYIRAGHGLPDPGGPSSSFETCIEGSSTIFTGPNFTSTPVECLNPLWITIPSVAEKENMVAILTSLMTNVQDEMNQTVNTYVDQNIITQTGAVIPREAMSAIGTAAPNAFYVGIDQPWTDFDLTLTPTALETGIATANQSGRIYEAFGGVAAEYLGTTPTVLGGIFFLTFAIVVVMTVGLVTRSVMYGSMLGVLVLICGMFAGLFPVAGLFVLIGLLLLLGSTYIFRRFPT
ncbi:MAG: hypothetical protein CL755_12645 [Chloroflexi bacterium]|nr:hypothetical protein [Chloroflexota bacterium]|tara:strand:+ start:199 stop:1299 length:1101 start_codon:yes stop_codon:yes gene_type:complete